MCHMRSLHSDCSSPKEVNSLSGAEHDGRFLTSSQKVGTKVVMYSPMKKYPRALLKEFLDWYDAAKVANVGSE